MEHELIREQRDRGVAQLEKAIPLENPGAPERHRQRKAHDQLNERGLCNHADHEASPIDEKADQADCSFRGDLLIHRRHQPSPRLRSVNTPASIMPAILAPMSNAGVASRAAAAALPSVRPEIRFVRNIAPPAGRCLTTTSRSGRVIRASSGTPALIGPTGSSVRLAAKIVTAAKFEQTILVAGCGTKTRSANCSGGTEARAAGAICAPSAA